jgi:hypothetical protein
MNRVIPGIVLVGAAVASLWPAADAQRTQSPEESAARRAAAERLAPERAVAHSVSGTVTVTARCGEGYVSTKSYRPSVATVQIVSEQLVSCSGGQCRALQVVAKSDDGAPFDLELVVTCAS